MVGSTNMGCLVLVAHQVGRQQDDLNSPRLVALPIMSLSTTPVTRSNPIHAGEVTIGLNPFGLAYVT